MMNTYQAALQAWLEENPPNYGLAHLHSLLDFLWNSYTRENPIVSDEMKRQLSSMNRILSRLTLREGDELFDLVAQLCMEHERLAFREGFHVGVRLGEELRQL